MLAPLGVGEHELRFTGSAPSSYLVDVTFHLSVQELDLERAVSALFPSLAKADLPNNQLEKLRAHLVAAEALFSAQNLHKGLAQLEQFQKEVGDHVQPKNEPLASEPLGNHRHRSCCARPVRSTSSGSANRR